MDYIVSQGNQDMKKLYNKFDNEVLNKIPRGPVKQKKKFWIISQNWKEKKKFKKIGCGLCMN